MIKNSKPNKKKNTKVFKPIPVEELVISNMYELEALFNVLVRKNMISKQEVLEEVMKLKKGFDKKIN